LSSLGIFALLGVILAACGGGGAPPFRISNAARDVTISHCYVGPDGFAVAQIVVTNRSSYESDYVTTVAFRANGSRSLSGPGFERGVAPGKSVPDQVQGTMALSAHASVSCTVSSVRQTPTTVTTPTT
jgi:hypothetical protein